MKIFVSVLAAISAMLWIATAQAQYPERAIRFVVPWNAGGPVDLGARVIADLLTQRFGKSVLVDNRPGANGIVGTDAVAKALADGYTITVANVETMILNPQTYAKLPYDPRKEFEAVAFVGRLPLVLVARAGFEGNNGQDLARLARANPGKLTFGSWGIGSLDHVGMVMAEQATGINLLHVPYQGGAPAQQALLGNQIDFLMMQVPYAENQQRAGRVKIIGLTSAQRTALAPDIPTMAEQGYTGLEADQWVGLLVPTGTSMAIRDFLNREINAVLNRPSGAAKMREVGFEIAAGTPEGFRQRLATDYERWGRVVRQRDIKVQ